MTTKATTSTTTTSKEVAILEKQIKPLVRETLVISSPADMKVAAEERSQLKTYAASVKKSKEKLTVPMNAALKAARELYRPLEDSVEAQIELRNSAMSTYQIAAERAAAIEDEKIASRVGGGKGHLTPETAVKKMGEVDRPQTTVATDSGGVRFRTDKKLKITDEAELRLSVCQFAVQTGDFSMIELVPSQIFAFIKSEPADSTILRGAVIEEVKTPVSL